MTLQKVGFKPCRPGPDADGKAVIAALKTLQEKMRCLELERVKAEANIRQLSRSAHRCPSASKLQHDPAADGAGAANEELLHHLQSAEDRYNLLEKQLDYMRKMVEKAEEDKLSVVQRQACLLEDRADIQTKLQKLEKLESECLKLTSSQSEAEKKLEQLEQKVLAEERERKAAREKSSQLHRAIGDGHQQRSPASGSMGWKEKKVKTKASTVKSTTLPSPCVLKPTVLPFVAGMSTSRSHSVHANVQSVLHMMKHQPLQKRHPAHLHQRPTSLSDKEARRTLIPSQGGSALGSLSEVQLALQDELSQMSCEHQELVRQIEKTQKQELREDLERELDCLVKCMEDKGAQICRLRKHQLEKTEKLMQKAQELNSGASGTGKVSAQGPGAHRVLQRPPRKGKQKDMSQPKRAQRLQTNLKRSDILWEV